MSAVGRTSFTLRKKQSPTAEQLSVAVSFFLIMFADIHSCVTETASRVPQTEADDKLSVMNADGVTGNRVKALLLTYVTVLMMANRN